MPVLALLAVLLFSACREQEPVVARVGKLTITESEFQRKLNEVAESYQDYVLNPHGRRQFLDILIREKLVLAAARSSEVRKSSEFKEQWEKLKTEEEERLREGHDYLLTRMWIEDLRRRGVISASDQEARDYHRKHPVEVEVRHILLAGAKEAEEAAKKARGGASFAALAKSKSLDAVSADDGGRLPPAIYGEVIPELEEVVFRMRVGEIGGPLKSKFGYHVIRKEKERKIDFDSAKGRILALLEKQRLDKHLQSLQESYPVEVVDEQYK